MIRGLKVFGGIMAILLLTLLTGLANFGEYAIQFFTIQWAEERLASGDKVEYYLWLILVIVVLRSFLNYLRGILSLGTLMRSSRVIHSTMLFKVVHASLGDYLNRTSAG